MDFSWNNIDISTLTHAPGLENKRNDCFTNVVLQFVFHTPQIARYLWWKNTNGNKCKSCGKCIYCILNGYFILIYKKTKQFYAKEMHKLVNVLFPNRVPGKQEDAHEMLTFLLDELDNPTPLTNGRKPWQKVKNQSNKSAVKVLFGGKFESHLLCKKCKETHQNNEDFQGLNLDLNLDAGKNHRLKDYINAYFHTEFLDNYQCQRCKHKRHTYRKFFIVEQPKLLVIQLKRFRYDGKKNFNEIDIPLDLDLGKFLLKKRGFKTKPAEYKLYGYISHSGASIGNGHYTATMLGYDSNWYLYDDTLVSFTDPTKSQHAQPYILFYYKVHVEAPKANITFEMPNQTTSEIREAILSESRELNSNMSEEEPEIDDEVITI